jgi:hypothetical protein
MIEFTYNYTNESMDQPNTDVNLRYIGTRNVKISEQIYKQAELTSRMIMKCTVTEYSICTAI